MTGWMGKNTPPSGYYGTKSAGWGGGVTGARASAGSSGSMEEGQRGGSVKILMDRIIGNGTFGVVYEGRSVARCVWVKIIT
jgi:hypothetical protein